jgi:hypothetical protein
MWCASSWNGHGLFPHDLARETLDADLRWRNPEGCRRLTSRLIKGLYATFQHAASIEQQRIWYDILYLARHNPFIKPYFVWSALGSAYAEPASSQDHQVILEMVRRLEGNRSAQIAQHWLHRQPEAFLVYRTVDGELIGFMAQLALHRVTTDDCAFDPAVAAALEFVQRHGPIRPGEEISQVRFWMGGDTYQAVSLVLNLTAINSTIFWMTHPNLAWSFIAVADPDFLQPHFTSINIQRAPEAGFVVDGRHYGVFGHDWRLEPVAAWLELKAERYPLTDVKLEQLAATPPASLVVLSQPEFVEAARHALRDYARPDLLAANPLMRSRLVVDSYESKASPSALQALLREAVATLSTNPKDRKLHRALWHTYLEPAPSQERAAELLDLPFSTYRYHLANGVERVAAWLWQRELYGADH